MDDATQIVLRFLAPQVARDGGTVDADAAQGDLDWLCAAYALPMAALPYAEAGAAVVTLMDRPVPRGRTDPDATQYFGSYGLRDGACVPDLF